MICAFICDLYIKKQIKNKSNKKKPNPKTTQKHKQKRKQNQRQVVNKDYKILICSITKIYKVYFRTNLFQLMYYPCYLIG